MGDKSDIEWTDATWSPVTGCTKVSAGCKNCYAEREVVTRWSKNPKSVWFGRQFTDVQCHADKLDQPLRWQKPRRIFVCPRADLFHEAVPEQFILSVFVSMAAARWHTFQILTKRSARMLDLMTRWKAAGLVLREGAGATLRNVWLGVSAEDQKTLDERVSHLMKTPAAVHWVSAEPLIESVDMRVHLAVRRVRADLDRFYSDEEGPDGGMRARLNFVVAGGESGPNARPSHPDWFRSLRDQCAAAGVPFFFKQWGEWAPETVACSSRAAETALYISTDGATRPAAYGARNGAVTIQRTGKRATGRLLDGREHSEFPR